VVNPSEACYRRIVSCMCDVAARYHRCIQLELLPLMFKSKYASLSAISTPVIQYSTVQYSTVIVVVYL
jgi:hypothetical protein